METTLETPTTCRSKEYLHNYIENLDPKSADELLNLFHSLSYFETRDICKILDINLDNTDFAKPQEWCDKLRNEMQVNSIGFVWSYQKEGSMWGEPMNLHSKILHELSSYFTKFLNKI